MHNTLSHQLLHEVEPLEAFGERLRKRREKLGMRKQDVATGIGVSLTTIQQYENGQFPKGEYAVRLAQKLHCSLDWLLAGQGHEDGRELEADDARLIMVPRVEGRLSSQPTGFEVKSDDQRQYAFRREFLHSKGNPARMVLLHVTGDSMQPRIMDNDVVLVDQSQTTPIPGRIYAVAVENMIYLKIVDALPGKLILSSVNPDYAPIEAHTDGTDKDTVRIIGRAVWVGRELD